MLDPFVILAPVLLLPVVGLLRFIGCGSFSAADTTVGTIKVTDPSTVSLGPAETHTFTASDVNGHVVAATWSGPNINATSGVYTAPDPFVPATPPTTETVTATSTEAATVGATATATVTLTHAITVSLTPAAITLVPGAPQTFTQSVKGTPDQHVTWTINPPAPAGGKIDTSGNYVAPTPFAPGSPAVTVIATSKADPTSPQGKATVTLVSGNTATFVKSDVATQGSWYGVYGGPSGGAIPDQRYALPRAVNLVRLPAYLPNLLLPPTVQNFGDPTMSARGTQNPAPDTTRFSDLWIDPNALTIEFDFSDYAPHQVAIYFVDWDTANLRKQTVELRDAQVPGVVLDTQHLVNFTNGQYLVWRLTGHVVVRVTKDPGSGGNGAVISGIFFN